MNKKDILDELLRRVNEEIINGIDNLDSKESDEFFVEVGCWKFNVVKVDDNWELNEW